MGRVTLEGVLNLRGSDIPYNPLFKAYLLLGKGESILYVNPRKVTPPVQAYLRRHRVTCKPYLAVIEYSFICW